MNMNIRSRNYPFRTEKKQIKEKKKDQKLLNMWDIQYLRH